MPEDIIDAIREAEFEDFDEPLQAALTAYRAQDKATKKASAAKRQKLDSGEGTAGAQAGGDAEGEETTNVEAAGKLPDAE